MWRRRLSMTAWLLVVAVTAGLFPVKSLAASDGREALRNLTKNARTPREWRSVGATAQAMQQAQRHQVLRLYESRKAAARMEQMARNAITPELRLQIFRAAVLVSQARGVDLVSEVHQRTGQWSVLQATSGGEIHGRVTVAGEPTGGSITVVAFDSLGYVADVTETDADGYYGLRTGPGRFYVMTVSNGFVDELYDNVPAPFGSKEGWRSATLVEVTASKNAEGIDFDLDDGAVVRGVLRDMTGAPLAGEVATLRLTAADNPSTLLQYEVVTDMADGSYEIRVPAAGAYKLSAQTSALGPVWYNGKASWEEADPIVISSTADEVTGVDFTLLPRGAGMEVTGGAISGQIMGPTFISTVVLGFAVAFDAADTSIAGFGLSFLGMPYVIPGLPAGNYYVWGNDLLGDVIRPLFLPTAMNYVGEFYNNAKTPDQATLVTVTEGDTVRNINFQLEQGASIEGVVRGPDGQPLDSVFVIAVDAEIASVVDDPFFRHLQFELTITDQSGAYRITGLPPGEYVLRTLTVLKHGGTVLDEYYDGHHSLWDFENADRVPVSEGASVTGIDFTLDAPGLIAGVVKDELTGEPIPDAFLLPINLETGLPEIAFGNTDQNGAYGVGPLPTGTYALLCVSGEEGYLPELYDGAYELHSATPIQVTAGSITPNVDFTLARGATIAGRVRFPDGVPVGADSLYRFPVVAYDANTGMLMDYAFAQFSGGYRISNLLPGQYKVAAIPVLFGYATTYAGGGSTYDDPASDILTVGTGEVRTVDITLATATGAISGTVREAGTGAPIPQALVAAYDATGHMQGLGVAGMDLATFAPTSTPDTYTIAGLRPGTYYVRTFALTSIIPIGMELDLSALPIPDLGEGGIPDLTQLPLGPLPELPDLHLDLWYGNVPTMLADLQNFDLYALVLALVRHGFADEYEDDLVPLFLPLPFATQIPAGAAAVTVGTGVTAGVDFQLPVVGVEEFTAVESERNQELPREYALRPAYPNPFNPSTRIEWELPTRSEVRLQVYNLLGIHVKDLARGVLPAGVHSATWDGTDEHGLAVPSGVYLIRMEAGHFRATQKVLLIK